MNKKVILVGAIALMAGMVSSFGLTESVNAETATDTSTEAATAEKGTLTLVANGEDFVRQGFVTKDGWQIDFDHVYVTLADVKAYTTEPAFNPDSEVPLQPLETVSLVDSPQTVDLAEGGADAEPIIVAQTEAPPGTYNALSWQLVEGESEPISNQTIVLVGTASKDGETVDFRLNLDQKLAYTCGEFVGDERKGIVQAGENATVETTFHFDHIFGDADTPADDPLNQDALGFQPLADLAQNSKLEVDQSTLATELMAEDYQKLEEAVAGLGHVGEGHCSLADSSKS